MRQIQIDRRDRSADLVAEDFLVAFGEFGGQQRGYARRPAQRQDFVAVFRLFHAVTPAPVAINLRRQPRVAVFRPVQLHLLQPSVRGELVQPLGTGTFGGRVDLEPAFVAGLGHQVIEADAADFAGFADIAHDFAIDFESADFVNRVFDSNIRRHDISFLIKSKAV